MTGSFIVGEGSEALNCAVRRNPSMEAALNYHYIKITTENSLNHRMGSSVLLQKGSFLCDGRTEKLFSTHSLSSTLTPRRTIKLGKFKSLSSPISSDHIQNQFREEGFKAESKEDDRILRISSAIRIIPDFPKPGIIFQDITTLLLDPEAFKDTIDLFVERYKDKNIDVVAGLEARGFLFGPPIALAIGAKFVPMRKPKKLPGEVISEEYTLEYGTDKIEMHKGAVQAGERAIIIDDLIATGGTLSAAIRLLDRVDVEVVECACLIELPELKGRDKLGGKPLFILLSPN